MSLFSSSSSRTTRQSSSRHRSSSESRASKYDSRSPAIDFSENSDVATAVCVEISRLMMVNPDMTTGSFFNAMSNSQRDINKSDATLVISAAILSHIGNKKMSEKILSKSSTCSKMYREFGLDKPKLCEMFTIMMFAMNPTFCTMLNSSITISLTRAQDMLANDKDFRKEINTTSKMVKDGSWSKAEAMLILSPVRSIESGSTAGGSMVSRNRSNSISPDDSVTQVTGDTSYRQRIDTNDMMKHIRRAKTGIEPTFPDVFRSMDIPRPPLAQMKNNKFGIGYNKPPSGGMEEPAFQKMNDILGSQKTQSVNIRTGKSRTRRPKVEDFIDSESISESVLREPPFVNNAPWSNKSMKFPRPPTPTEIELKDTEYESSEASTLQRVNSYELLMRNLSVN